MSEPGKRELTLPDGTTTDNYSVEYQRYCEALELSKKSLEYRRQWLLKLNSKKQENRVSKLQYWLRFMWDKKQVSK